MNQNQLGLKQAGFLMLLLWLAVDSFKAVCASVSKEICGCCFSLSWWFGALWGPGWSAALSPVLATGDTFPGNRTPLWWELPACHESSSAHLLMESGINARFLLFFLSPGLYFWSCPAVVLWDSLLHKYIFFINTAYFLLWWCLSFRWSIILY